MIDNYKIIKKLGFGGQGAVYLTEYKNKKYALKKEKMNNNDVKKNLGSQFWREIEFITNMNKKCPNHFLKLYDYDIIDDCKFNLDNPRNLEIINNMNKNNFCNRKIYELVDTTLDKILNKLESKEIYSILIQIIYAVYIMNSNGYTHCDFHLANVGIINTKTKFIKILDKKIPTFGYLVKIIDYGSILHKKYKLKNTSFGIHESKLLEKSNNDIYKIKNFLFISFFYNSLTKDFWKKNDYNKIITSINESKYILLVDNLVKNQENKLLLLELLYPTIHQKFILGKEFKKTLEPKLLIRLVDLLFLLKEFEEEKVDIKKILNYFIIVLNEIINPVL